GGLLTIGASALGSGCALNQVQTAVPSRSWDIDGIGFNCVALFSGSALGFLAHGTRDPAYLAFRGGAGDPFLGAAVLAFFPGSSLPYFAHLPVPGAIGKQRSFLRFNRV